MENLTDNELIKLINFYQENLQPFKYIYKLELGIELNFMFEPSQIPHLIFGTIPSFKKSSDYRGEKGYNNIINGVIKSVPNELSDAFKGKSKGFKFLPTLLENPEVYHFNNLIVQSGTGYIKGMHSKVDADFLLHKEKTHLFIKYDRKKEIFVPVSIVYNKVNTYTLNQIKMKIVSEKKGFKCYRDGFNTKITSVI